MENRVYSGQITVYGGKVIAEIIYKSEKLDGSFADLYMCSHYKKFGRWFQSEPRKIDYINARKYLDKHFDLLEQYGTQVVKKPQPIIEHIRANASNV